MAVRFFCATFSFSHLGMIQCYYAFRALLLPKQRATIAERTLSNMNHHRVSRIEMLLSILLLSFFATNLSAQDKKSAAVPKPLIKQTVSRREGQRLGFGSTVTLVGAPSGSIMIEGWQRSEVDVTAEIELQAETEEDLKRLATVNGFTFNQDMNHVRILSTGTHDKEFMRRADKNFPKKLIGLPWKIDYRIRVPFSTDLEIDAGRGPISIAGVVGAIRIAAPESEAKLELSGGTVSATIVIGRIDLKIPVRSWRGSGAEIRLAAGDLTVEFPVGFNGNIDAEVLRNGTIEDGFGALESRERPGITPRLVKARAGAGGAFFKFIVGDGKVHLKKKSE